MTGVQTCALPIYSRPQPWQGCALPTELFPLGITRFGPWRRPRTRRDRLVSGAGNEARTRDLNLGKVALYQLSYSRVASSILEARSRVELD